eukprot:8291101-Karenia_brevis.AAC.1
MILEPTVMGHSSQGHLSVRERQAVSAAGIPDTNADQRDHFMGGHLSVNEGWVMTPDTAETDAVLRDTDQADQLQCGHPS